MAAIPALLQFWGSKPGTTDIYSNEVREETVTIFENMVGPHLQTHRAFYPPSYLSLLHVRRTKSFWIDTKISKVHNSDVGCFFLLALGFFVFLTFVHEIQKLIFFLSV